MLPGESQQGGAGYSGSNWAFVSLALVFLVTSSDVSTLITLTQPMVGTGGMEDSLGHVCQNFLTEPRGFVLKQKRQNTAQQNQMSRKGAMVGQSWDLLASADLAHPVMDTRSGELTTQ